LSRQKLMSEPRARSVAFRLSSAQYECLHNAFRDAGARSLSEFARSAILAQITKQQTPQGLLLHDLISLSNSLQALDVKLGDLRVAIHSLLGIGRPADGDRGISGNELPQTTDNGKA
jgi:hypothetical protein